MNARSRFLLALTAMGIAPAILVTSACGQTVTQNFNAAGGGTFLSDWNQNGTNAPNLYQDTAGDGLGGTNAVALTSDTGDCTAIFRSTAFNLSVGTTVTVSAYFRDQQIGVGTANQAAFQIGFGSSAGDANDDVHTGTPFDDSSGDDNVDSNSLKNFITARVLADGAIEFQTAVSGAVTDSAITSTVALTAGNWYFLTGTFTVNATTNTFSGTSSLSNSNSAGVLGTQLLSTSSTTLSDSVLWDDPTTSAGFRAVGQTSGVNGVSLVDNFSASAVPEPASTLLLLGGGTLFALRRRRIPATARRR